MIQPIQTVSIVPLSALSPGGDDAINLGDILNAASGLLGDQARAVPLPSSSSSSSTWEPEFLLHHVPSKG